MNARIKELQDFANEFNRKLELSEESDIKEKRWSLTKRLKKPLSAMASSNTSRTIFKNNISSSNKNQNTPKIKRAIKSCKKNQRKLNNNIYKNLLPWIPPLFVGKYFEDFKILQDKHNISSWEKVTYKDNLTSFFILYLQNRIGLCERTYIKEHNLPFKKPFICRKLVNDEINHFPKEKSNVAETTKNMTFSGKNIITTFINQYEKNEQRKRDEEERLYKYKHSKPPLRLNPWKYSNHVIGEFSRPKIDDVYTPKEKIKPKYQYTVDPFRRPGDHGDYFDKHIGIL